MINTCIYVMSVVHFSVHKGNREALQVSDLRIIS